MMAEKAKLFGDQEVVTRSWLLPTPKTARRYGRKVHDFNVLAIPPSSLAEYAC